MGNYIKILKKNKGIRIFIFVFLGMILMLIIQLEMRPTRKLTILSGDDAQNMAGVSRLRRSTARSLSSTRRPEHTDLMVNSIPKPKVIITAQNLKALDEVTRPGYDLKSQFCTDKSKWKEKLSAYLGRVTSNVESYKFSHTVECPKFNASELKFEKRPRLSISCNRRKVLFDSLSWTATTSDVFVAPFGDSCVDEFIQQCCKGQYRVPNIVHYVWYMRGELSFVGFTSLLGVIRFISPCVIIFHGDNIPHGKYWDFIVNISPNIIHLKRNRPTSFSGQKIKHKEHSSDIMRIEALIKYGGIYMDTDTVIVKPLELLRNYSCVMSNQSSGLMGSAFVMAEQNATFLQLWMDGYRYHYNSSKYTYNAMVYPKQLARKHRDLIHIEYATISRPKNMIGGKIYYNEYATFDWSSIYGIHLYSRIYKKPFNEHSIRNMNTTVGSISRHVVFGNKELCS